MIAKCIGHCCSKRKTCRFHKCCIFSPHLFMLPNLENENEKSDLPKLKNLKHLTVFFPPSCHKRKKKKLQIFPEGSRPQVSSHWKAFEAFNSYPEEAKKKGVRFLLSPQIGTRPASVLEYSRISLYPSPLSPPKSEDATSAYSGCMCCDRGKYSP